VADPSKFDLSDWFSVIVTSIASGIVAGITSAMGWFRRTKLDMYDRITLVEGEMRDWNESHAKHETQLAVMQTCQQNTEERLDAIDRTTRDTNQNLQELSKTIVTLINQKGGR
jgi:septal ring factor EnvC (AmiA/AmiB activator)